MTDLEKLTLIAEKLMGLKEVSVSDHYQCLIINGGHWNPLKNTAEGRSDAFELLEKCAEKSNSFLELGSTKPWWISECGEQSYTGTTLQEAIVNLAVRLCEKRNE